MTDPDPYDETDAGSYSEHDGDAILRDDALLDALGRGELPATFRADVTARLLTNWRDDLDEGLPPLTTGDLASPVLLATARGVDDTDVLPLFSSDDTAQLPRFAERDRIDESVRTAFVAAGYARPTEQLPPVRPADDTTQQFPTPVPQFPTQREPVSPVSDTEAPPTDLDTRRVRRRRLDRVVVAAAAVAAVLAAGSAGSVAAASTAHPGDTLWPISRVIYAERARSIEASEDAHASLRKAREAMKRGDTEAAKRYYADAREKLDGHVREGSDEADKLTEDLQSTAALPEFQAQPDAPWYAPIPDPSTSSGATTNPSSRSRWQRGPRGGGTTTVPTPPASGSTPTPGVPTTQPDTGGPTTGEPGPQPSTQQPEPTPSEPANSPDPVPSESPSSSGPAEPDTQAPVEQAPAAQQNADGSPATAE